MAFREFGATEIREVLRAWLSGSGLRKVAEQAGVDRKTARRYVQAAAEGGLARDGGPGQLTDELVGQDAEAVRPVRLGGHGRAWDQLEACQAEITGQVKAGLSVVKIGVLLERRSIMVSYRTLHRFCVERCGFGKTAATVRVADGEPEMECQIDFGYLGTLDLNHNGPFTGSISAQLISAAAGPDLPAPSRPAAPGPESPAPRCLP